MPRLLALDPGGVSGWCLFVDGEPVRWGTFDTAFHGIEPLLGATRPDQMVVESYRLYGAKAAAQINSDLETAQLIGALRYAAGQLGIPVTLQPASMIHDRPGHLSPPLARLVDPHLPKVSAQRHERDAMAHGYRSLGKTNDRHP